MEKSGRRPLLLYGMAVMILADVIITVSLVLQDTVHFLSYACCICIIAVVIGFSIGLGSIPQFITAELFKQGPRPPAMSLAGFINWLCNFIVAMTFPSMKVTYNTSSHFHCSACVLLKFAPNPKISLMRNSLRVSSQCVISLPTNRVYDYFDGSKCLLSAESVTVRARSNSVAISTTSYY